MAARSAGGRPGSSAGCGTLESLDHFQRPILGDGRQTEVDVLENLHKGAAQAELSGRPEVRVPGHSQDRLPALSVILLDRLPWITAPGLARALGRQDLPCSLAGCHRHRNIQLHSTHVEFVEDVRGDDFQGHGYAQVAAARPPGSPLWGPDKGRHREAVAWTISWASVSGGDGACLEAVHTPFHFSRQRRQRSSLIPDSR